MLLTKTCTALEAYSLLVGRVSFFERTETYFEIHFILQYVDYLLSSFLFSLDLSNF